MTSPTGAICAAGAVFSFLSNQHQAAREEMDIEKWEAFIDREKERGVNLAILIGGEPTLTLDRVQGFLQTSADVLCH